MPMLDALREALETQKDVVIKEEQQLGNATWRDIAAAIQKNPHLTSITFPAETNGTYYVGDEKYIEILAKHPTLVAVHNLTLDCVTVNSYKLTNTEPFFRREFEVKKQLLNLKKAWPALISQLNNQETNWLESLKDFNSQLVVVKTECQTRIFQQGLFDAFYASIKAIYEPLSIITSTIPPKELYIPCYHELLCRYLAESIHQDDAFLEKLVLVNVPNVTEPGRMINALRQLIKEISCLAFKDCDIAQIEALILKTINPTNRFKTIEFIDCTNLHNLQVTLTSQKGFTEFKSSDKQNKSQLITTNLWNIKNQVLDDVMINALVDYYKSIDNIEITLDDTYIQNDQLKKLLGSLQPGTNLYLKLAGNTLENLDCHAITENRAVHLTSLLLKKTILTIEQLTSLATAIASASNMQWLVLNDIYLADQCKLTALTSSVASKKNLAYFKLSEIKNGDVNDTSAFLIAVLKARPPLISLSLRNTLLNPEAINEVIAFVNANNTLLYLDLEGVTLTPEHLEALKKALEDNIILENIFSSSNDMGVIKTYTARNCNKKTLANLIGKREQLIRSSLPSEWTAWAASNRPVSKDILHKASSHAAEIIELKHALCPNTHELYAQAKEILLQIARHIWQHGAEPDADLTNLNKIAMDHYFLITHGKDRIILLWALLSAAAQNGNFNEADWILDNAFHSQLPSQELDAMAEFYMKAQCDWFIQNKQYKKLLERAMSVQPTWLYAAYDGYFQTTPITVDNIDETLRFAHNAQNAKHPNASHMIKHCYLSHAFALKERLSMKQEACLGMQMTSFINYIQDILSLPHDIWKVETLERPITLLSYFATYAKYPLQQLMPLADIAIQRYTEYGVPPEHPLYETWLETYLRFLKASIRQSLLTHMQENHKQYFFASVRFTSAHNVIHKLDKANDIEWGIIIDKIIKENTQRNGSQPAYLSWLNDLHIRLKNTLELLAQHHASVFMPQTTEAPPAPAQEPVGKLRAAAL